MQMNGNMELITIAKYWKDWRDPRLIVLVLNNRDLNQVTWELRAMGGSPKVPATQDLPDFPYAEYAESLGLAGIRMNRPEDVGLGWDLALSSDRPVVVEARVDPDVPPLPPHITFDQASSYMQAVAKGDPERWGMLRASMRDMVESYLPHGQG
jgi:pyruvate dehydrogenase (quinone)